MNWLWSVYDPTMEGGSESIHKVSAHFSVLSNTGRGIGIGTFRSDIGLCIITLLFFEHPKFIIRCLFQHKFVGCTHWDYQSSSKKHVYTNVVCMVLQFTLPDFTPSVVDIQLQPWFTDYTHLSQLNTP